jgi:hypothetical protein
MNIRKYNSGKQNVYKIKKNDEEIKRQKGELRKFLYTCPSGKEGEVCVSTCLTVRLTIAIQAYLFRRLTMRQVVFMSTMNRFNISYTATRSVRTDGDTSCVIVTHRPVQIQSAAHFAFLYSCVHITLKALSYTKRKRKIESITQWDFRSGKNVLKLFKRGETTERNLRYREAISFIGDLSPYRFLISIIVWYDILSYINLLSKVVKITKHWLEVEVFPLSWQEAGFKDALCKAKEQEEMCMPSDFSEIRVRRRCQLSSYESRDEAQPQDEKIFSSEVLSVTLHSAIMSLQSSSALLST